MHDMADVPAASIEILDSVEWSHCPAAKKLYFQDRDRVFRQGEALGEHVYWLADGYAKLLHISRCGTESLVALLRGRQLLEAGDLPSGEARLSCVAKGSIEVWRIPRSAFDRRVELGGPGVRTIVDRLSTQLTGMTRRVEILLQRSVEMRVSLTLLDLLGEHGQRCRHGHEIDVPLTHQELADLIGASRPVVSAILSDLRQRGLISYCREFICIDDLSAMRSSV